MRERVNLPPHLPPPKCRPYYILHHDGKVLSIPGSDKFIDLTHPTPFPNHLFHIKKSLYLCGWALSQLGNVFVEKRP